MNSPPCLAGWLISWLSERNPDRSGINALAVRGGLDFGAQTAHNRIMHSCPECGHACYCNGDIDDIDVGDEDAEDNCMHCAEGGADDDDPLDDWTDLEEVLDGEPN